MLTRRTVLAASAATVAVPAIRTGVRAATPKGVAVMARSIDDIVSFDPAESYEFTNNEIDANCYRRLIRPDANDATKIEADLAEKWTVSPDGTEYTFQLRDSAWQDGQPVTADDVIFTIHQIQSPTFPAAALVPAPRPAMPQRSGWPSTEPSGR
jgi:peptide/nickel transport system substrate-binding protein